MRALDPRQAEFKQGFVDGTILFESEATPDSTGFFEVKGPSGAQSADPRHPNAPPRTSDAEFDRRRAAPPPQ